jgi:hypothetical protein
VPEDFGAFSALNRSAHSGKVFNLLKQQAEMKQPDTPVNYSLTFLPGTVAAILSRPYGPQKDCGGSPQ